MRTSTTRRRRRDAVVIPRTEVNGQKLLIPSFEEGCRADLTNVSLPQVIGAAGEVKQLVSRRMTSPVAPNSEGSVPLFDSVRQPLLEGGDKALCTAFAQIPSIFSRQCNHHV
jgi:hypothetical protein